MARAIGMAEFITSGPPDTGNRITIINAGITATTERVPEAGARIIDNRPAALVWIILFAPEHLRGEPPETDDNIAHRILASAVQIRHKSITA